MGGECGLRGNLRINERNSLFFSVMLLLLLRCRCKWLAPETELRDRASERWQGAGGGGAVTGAGSVCCQSKGCMIARKGSLRLWCGGSSGWGFVVVAAAAPLPQRLINATSARPAHRPQRLIYLFKLTKKEKNRTTKTKYKKI